MHLSKVTQLMSGKVGIQTPGTPRAFPDTLSYGHLSQGVGFYNRRASAVSQAKPSSRNRRFWFLARALPPSSCVKLQEWI